MWGDFEARGAPWLWRIKGFWGSWAARLGCPEPNSLKCGVVCVCGLHTIFEHSFAIEAFKRETLITAA